MLMHSWPEWRSWARYRPFDRSAEVGVGQHDHGVLAAELAGEGDEPSAALLGHDPTGGGQAGEHEVIDRLDDRAAEARPRASDDPEQVVGEAGLEEELDHRRPR